MQLKTLQLVNFRNYADVKLDISPKINVLTGSNGSGKTNLLDAIHYLSLTKSAFAASDNHAIRHGEKFFSIKGVFFHGKSETEVFCAVQAGSKKIFKEGPNEYNKLSGHIGRYPVVLIAPDDTDIVREGSEDRRKFFDSMISQLDRTYLEALIQYNQALRQRNSLLKMFAEGNSYDPIILESYDKVMAGTAEIIFTKRKDFIQRFIPIFKNYYNFIVEDEHASIQYQSELLTTDFTTGLEQNRQRDLFLQRSNFGVHRDDFVFNLDQRDLKRLGSQGQKKSFIIALKLAQFEMVKVHKGLKPILLLDDIFDKLDDWRIQRLLEMIRKEEFGQLFITDARPDRTSSLLESIGATARFFIVEKGIIKEHGQ
jgi:DNA replication and repair protein RecF